MSAGVDLASLQAAGWKPSPSEGFTGIIGPFWVWRSEGIVKLGFFPESRHTNHIGNVHGGMLTSFADNALGYGVVEALGGPGALCATAQLQIQFVAPARIGEFVSCCPEVIRRSTHLVFVRGLIVAGGRTVASADGIWKVLKPEPGAAPA